MKKRMKIVIVDSGIKKSHIIFNQSNIYSYVYHDGILEQVFCDNDEYGHGTAVAGIICKNTHDVDIIMISVPGIEYGIEESVLISILRIINNMDGVGVVNLSLGINVCENYDELYNICSEITNNGICIISAFDNSGSISYPAAFDNVIGVITGSQCTRISDFEFFEDTVLNIAAKGNMQRVAWIDSQYMLISGNSFACAHVASQTIKFIQAGAKNTEEVLREFNKISNNHYSISSLKKQHRKLFKITKASIFPFNKEMHSLLRYAHLLSFEIVSVYDTKYSTTIGASTRHLLHDNRIDKHIIKNIDNIEWNEFDTLIIGHTDELSSLIDNKRIVNELIDRALQENKQIYCFDDISKSEYKSNSQIFYPKIDNTDLPPNRMGMLYRISKPVLGIFGTSSRQGKFTLQLKLREIMLQQGYKVGQIGTEPSSLLYGMDYCFPMGYNSSVYIKEFDVIRYINSIINDLCLKDNDIILIGSHSGTIPYDTGNIMQYNISQYELLIGTNPDCVILCINPFDDMEYVERTVHFIESSANCKVISLVVFPMDIEDNWTAIYGSRKLLKNEKYTSIKTVLQNKLGIPVLKLGCEDDMNTIVEIITDFFTE